MDRKTRRIHEEYLEYLNSRIKDIKESINETTPLEYGIGFLTQLDNLISERYKVELALAEKE